LQQDDADATVATRLFYFFLDIRQAKKSATRMKIYRFRIAPY